jgi:hypothetical protein
VFWKIIIGQIQVCADGTVTLTAGNVILAAVFPEGINNGLNTLIGAKN